MKKRIFSIFLALALLLGLPSAAGAGYTERSFSDALVQYIKDGEGFMAQPYYAGGYWYIGYGCQVNKADYPNGITEAEAEALLREKMELFAGEVRKFARRYDIGLTQGQFDAMCAMSYAMGPAWLNAANRLPGYLISGIDGYTDQQIATALGAYCHVGGAVNTGALRRRIMELKMFLYEDYSCTADGWSWLTLDANGGSNEFSDVALYKTGAPYGTLPVATRSGYFFAGWQTAEGRVLTAEDTVAEPLAVKALWTTAAPESTPTPEPTPEPDPAPEEPSRFPDVAAEAWYYPYVTALAEQGVVHGYPDGTFRPEDSVTWGEALKLILLAAGYPEQTPPEVQEGETPPHWAAGYLDYAIRQELLPETAAPDLDSAITRDAVADLCAAALALPAPAGTETPFADSSRDSVLALYEAGIVIGSLENGQRLYHGGAALRRAEICTILTRVMDYVEEHFILYLGYRIPVDFDLRPNPYDPAAFSTDAQGRIRYDGAAVRYGVDVSAYQHDIDWALAASDGIDFAMIRCGFRGYGTGSLNEDGYFRQNVRGALDAGLDVGVYFFSQAISVEEAREEAAYVLELVEGYDLTYPVCFDWEPQDKSGSRTCYYDGTTVTDCALAFCETVAAAGYRPIIYFNPFMAYLKLDISRLQTYDNWLAHYTAVSSYRYDFQMWQYGTRTGVKGFKGEVDMDIAFVDLTRE